MSTIHCVNPTCGIQITDEALVCPICNRPQPTPIQRQLLINKEQSALNERYQSALQQAVDHDCQQLFEWAEQRILNDSHAVINLSNTILLSLLENKHQGSGLSNYYLQVDAECRSPAHSHDDRKRNAIDGLLFGSFSSKIRFAALSLNHQGLISYGDCAITIHQELMNNRSTLLEENSYNFVDTHHISVTDCQLPVGYRACWNERHKLAMAKITPQLLDISGQDEEQLAKLVLFSSGERTEDQFIEVHIYDTVLVSYITKIHLPVIAPDSTQTIGHADQHKKFTLELIKHHATKAGIEIDDASETIVAC